MAVKYQDYYQVLGVSRSATQKEIQQAYRKLARQYHPDVNKAKDAEARFKEINEANEVLGDPDKRKRYDELGADWKPGQEFRPPPGWGGPSGGGAGGRARQRGGHPGANGEGFQFEGGSFSDFFEQIFGGGGAFRGGRGGADIFGNMGGEMGPDAFTQESELTITLEDAYHGATKHLTLRDPADGSTRNLQVKIPPGATDGTTIRLAGQGGRGPGGQAGDLRLKLTLAPHDRFKVEGHDLVLTLPISPWEAALGAKVPVATLDGTVTLTLPPGSQSGQRLRLKERGLPQRGGTRGDLYAVLRVTVPKPLSDVERRLFEELQKESKFDPRG